MKDNLSPRDAAALRATFDGHTLVVYKPRLIHVIDAVPDGTTDHSTIWRRRAPQVLKQHSGLHHGTVVLDTMHEAGRQAVLRAVHDARQCYLHRNDLTGWSAFSLLIADAQAGGRAHAVGGSRHVTPHANRYGGRVVRGF